MAAARYQVVYACLVVAAAYYMSAVLGLLWAIPPGFATLVWPPAGIALGAVYVGGPKVLPGVWVGSFMANFWVHGGSDFECGAIPATGAALAAWAGGAAMQWLLVEPWLWNPARLLRFFLIAAFAAIVNATWSPWLLAQAGCLDAAGVWHQMRVWYAGDAIGACLFAPLVVFLSEEAIEHDSA